jgi:Protein of unknown function (DUF3237)
MSLEHLFDAELQYREGMAPITADGEGQLTGSGGGVARGQKLTGALRWTLFEQPGELVCQMNPILQIATGDGAQVRVKGRGFGKREHLSDQRWRVAATLRFESDDERYAWLNGRLGVWEGEFDADAHQARYHAFLTPDPAVLPAAA